MIKKLAVEITPEMTGSHLHDLLAMTGAKLIVETLEDIENGIADRIPQSGETCYASMITKEELKIDFTQSAKQVYDFIRAMADVPCAYVMMDGKRFKVFRAQISNEETDAEPGTIIWRAGRADGCPSFRGLFLPPTSLSYLLCQAPPPYTWW